jgi:hypothetical protein
MAVIFPLMLAVCEATACYLECDQCPMTVCCIPSVVTDNSITQDLAESPYSIYITEATPKQFCCAIFHPPRA